MTTYHEQSWGAWGDYGRQIKITALCELYSGSTIQWQKQLVLQAFNTYIDKGGFNIGKVCCPNHKIKLMKHCYSVTDSDYIDLDIEDIANLHVSEIQGIINNGGITGIISVDERALTVPPANWSPFLFPQNIVDKDNSFEFELYYITEKYNEPYTYSGSLTIYNFFADIKSKYGVDVPNFATGGTVYTIPDGATALDMLSYFAALGGTNIYIDGSSIQYVEYAKPSASSYFYHLLDKSKIVQDTLSVEDISFEINYLECDTGNGVISSGSGNGIHFYCPYMTQALLDSILQSKQSAYISEQKKSFSCKTFGLMNVGAVKLDGKYYEVDKAYIYFSNGGFYCNWSSRNADASINGIITSQSITQRLTNLERSRGASGVSWGAITGTLANQTDLQNALNGKVNKSGGTVTGDINLEKSSGDTYLTAKRTDTNVKVGVGVGSSGANHGVYSWKLGKWLVYGDNSNVYLKGNADTATRANKLSAGQVGSATKPVYINSDGVPTAANTMYAGLTVTQLFNGTATDTGDFSVSGYKIILICMRVNTNEVSRSWGAMPVDSLYSTTYYQDSDDADWGCFTITRTGDNVRFVRRSGNGVIKEIWGIK